MDNSARVYDVFKVIVGTDLEKVQAITRENEPRWDSLKHVELIFALEDEFEIQFTQSEMEGLKELEQIVTLINAKAAA